MNRWTLALFAALIGPAAHAGIITTQESLQARPADAAAVEQARRDREHLHKVLMADGISADKATERVRALTDAEVHRLASLIDVEPIGEGR